MQTIPSTPSAPVRVLVTDDTALYRRTISDILKSIPDVEVIGAAFDGEDCLALAEKHRPDLITLDIQMPRRDGLSTLEELKKRRISSEVVMVCSETTESADQTLQALRNGALDMILKPNGNNLVENKKNLEGQLIKQIQTVQFRKGRRSSSSVSIAADRAIPASNIRMVASPETRTTPSLASQSPSASFNPKCVCIGISTGGPQALGVLVQGLSKQLPVPIFIVQHMPPLFTKSLADHLSSGGRIKATEGVNGEMAEPGRIYIAPGGKQMKVERKGTQFQIVITDDPPIGACKPSVDYLFQSVDQCVGKDCLAVIMTGMGNDGLAGCKKLFASGAHILAQSADTCVVYGMPRQIAENNLAHEILPLEMIASRIQQLVRK
jgi:two-component system, chemotaxis family, protein-glutamate methylesterase/glutaminase